MCCLVGLCIACLGVYCVLRVASLVSCFLRAALHVLCFCGAGCGGVPCPVGRVLGLLWLVSYSGMLLSSRVVHALYLGFVNCGSGVQGML